MVKLDLDEIFKVKDLKEQNRLLERYAFQKKVELEKSRRFAEKMDKFFVNIAIFLEEQKKLSEADKKLHQKMDSLIRKLIQNNAVLKMRLAECEKQEPRVKTVKIKV
jgi:hypothetical protein